MAFVRSIGRWTMTALVINCIIGGGIFGVPGELTRLLGRASPIAMILAALGTGVIMACFAEVASQFSEPGGPYLYVRTAFGRFLGIQIGWFHLLGDMLGVAALATLFVNYATTFLPWHLNTWERALMMGILLTIPAVANCLGVRSGANFSNVLTIAKLSPLLLLVLLGITRFAHQPQMIHASEITAPGLSNWIRAMMFLLFAFAGPEGALIPSGEIREPRRTIPFGLAAGLLSCAAIYMLLQFITVATIGTKMTDRPLADTASVLLGGGGAAFVSIAVMISTYGWISGALLYAPRLAFALAAQGDAPGFLAKLHPRFHTPAVAIILYAFAAWLLASSGTFLWIIAIGSGAIAVYFAASCATLIPLRKLRPNVQALRVPLGPLLSVLGVAISVALITGLKKNELILLGVPALIATANWLWAKRRREQVGTVMKPTAAS
jgi:basic amino acid/polyamine antiporter, APA family